MCVLDNTWKPSSSADTSIIIIITGYSLLKFIPLIFFLLTEGSSDRRRHIPFQIPHSLVFLPDRREVCVADRENGRIQCFLADTAKFTKEIKKKEFGGEVFAITYSPAAGEITHWAYQSVFYLCPLVSIMVILCGHKALTLTLFASVFVCAWRWLDLRSKWGIYI